MPAKFAFDNPDDALRALAEKLEVVPIDRAIAIAEAGDRVLATPILADRDSPAADVSAMDGYAVRLHQVQIDAPVRVDGQSVPGAPPPSMSDDGVVQIFTGAVIPRGTEAVVKREDTHEEGLQIRFRESAVKIADGENIRLAGENAASGTEVLPSGKRLTAVDQAVAVNFGCFDVDCFQAVKVGVITTGDEIGLFADKRPEVWQLQNSNQFAIAGLLKTKRWIDVIALQHCSDDQRSLAALVDRQLESCDAVLLTGGVSMGDYDYVPDVVRSAGGEIVFHGLPLRPGKPILGAATASGKLIVGLPGNPVSASIGCRRMALPLLAKLSGQTDWLPHQPVVRLAGGDDDRTLPLHWLRLVRYLDHGLVEAIASRGSGDLVSMGRSDGFIEVPPMGTGEGPWPFYSW